MTAELEIEESSTVTFTCKRKLAAFIESEVEPVGRWFHTYEQRRRSRASECEQEVSEDSDSSEHDFEIEDNSKYLKTLDSRDWKNQDHYAVLGIKKNKYRANQEDIKKAYRAMLLQYHPDKNVSKGKKEMKANKDFFDCFKHAFDILGNEEKRRAYDSVDPDFDDDIPGTGTNTQKNFFDIYTPVFERNARWSVRKYVPLLGKLEDCKEKVEKFYNFWYDFDSWREFSYLDKEDTDQAQDRDERRWMDRQNKAERARRKKEEVSRIRRLVDNAYTIDPRIAKFKEEERQERLAKKQAKVDAIRKKQEEKEKRRRDLEEQERKKKEAEEAALKEKQLLEKKQKDATKKVLKFEKKTLRNICKESNYFINNIDEEFNMMTNVEFLCEGLDVESFQEFNRKLLDASDDREAARKVFLDQVTEVKALIERGGGCRPTTKSSIKEDLGSKLKSWTSDDVQMLIKAVNLFPAGTVKRWDVVAEYLNQHSTHCTTRGAKDVLNKAKELQNSDDHMKEAAKKNAFSAVEKTPAMVADSTASQRLETPAEMAGFNTSPWSPDEQRLLEQALKTYPTSVADRWDKISGCLPNRSKKDCMKRYKELVERVKAKKAAKVAAGVAK